LIDCLRWGRFVMLTVKHDPIPSRDNPLSQAVRSARSAFWGVGLFSLAVNLLMLTGPLFMLQIYDRVLTSRSVPTLVALFGLVVALYGFLGLFEFFRSRILSRVGYQLDEKLARPSLKVWIASRLSERAAAGRPVTDLSSVRNFLSSQGLPALFDLPWVPIYLAIVFLLHAQLGLLALAGLVIVLVLAIANEWLTRKPLGEAIAAENREAQFAEHALRNSDVIVSLGMASNISGYWSRLRDAAKARAQAGGDLGEGFASSSKAMRLLLQSAILGLGGYLAIQGQISAGTIVAASILAGRALAPIDQTIGNWRNIVRAREAYRRLMTSLAGYAEPQRATQLPEPSGALEVNRIIKFAPNAREVDGGARRPILHGLDFKLKAGDALGVIGPSAAGKSTLARMLVGLSVADQGSVRLDGATFDQWDPDVLGRYIGYLPQNVELLPGTLKQNIARFDPEATDSDVIAAAQLAGAHELIVRLPDGYATEIGFGQPPLSGGQAQRIALARALFRQPKLIVLDEPSSNLDVDGDTALTRAIIAMRRAGSVVIIMTHRPTTIAAANLVLMIREGRQAEFGPKSEVLNKVTRQSANTPSSKGVGGAPGAEVAAANRSHSGNPNDGSTARPLDGVPSTTAGDHFSSAPTGSVLKDEFLGIRYTTARSLQPKRKSKPSSDQEPQA
jgi:ATP-binding cassette, subfamily C, bacterial exporter for protease/lipase